MTKQIFKIMTAAVMLAALVVLAAAAVKFMDVIITKNDTSPVRLDTFPTVIEHPKTQKTEESDSQMDVPTEPFTEKYYVTSEILNVRSGPGTDYSVIGSLTRGMEIRVTSIDGEEGNRWAKFSFEGLTAYAFADHLAKKK